MKICWFVHFLLTIISAELTFNLIQYSYIYYEIKVFKLRKLYFLLIRDTTDIYEILQMLYNSLLIYRVNIFHSSSIITFCP